MPGAAGDSESLRHGPGLHALTGVILVGALVMVVTRIAKRGHTSRSVQGPGRRCSARDEVCGRFGENTGPMTEAEDTLKSPGVEASPLSLQTLCSSAMSKHLSRWSVQNTVDLLPTARKSQLPKLSQETDETSISKASGIDGERPQRNLMGDLNKNTHYPDSPELLQEENMGLQRKIQEQEEEKQRLERPRARREQVLQDRVSWSLSVAGNPLRTSTKPDDLGARVDDGNSKSPPKRGAGNGDGLILGWEVDLKGVPRAAEVNVSQENQAMARQLREEKQMDEQLSAEKTSLQTEKASLQRENANLIDEIEQLRLQLQILPATREDHVTQLQKQLTEAEAHRLEMEKKFPEVWRQLNSTYQLLNTYKKMAHDLNQELRRSSFHYQTEIRDQQSRAAEAWRAAQANERKFQDLRRENDRYRQMLARVSCKFQPFPRGPLASAAPPAAPRGTAVPGRPLGPQEGPAVRAPESRAPSRCDSAFPAAGR